MRTMLKAYRYLPAALLAMGVWISSPACASQVYGYRGDNYRDVQRRAYDNGYHEGLEHGEQDVRSGRPFSFTRQGDYRDADEGYHRGDGDREFYRRAFRQGFEAGYSEAFNRTAGRYGNSYPRSTYPEYPPPSYSPAPGYPAPGVGQYYGSPAAQIGHRDGLEVGRDDARDRESFDPIRSKRYRSADHDYDGRYGPKEAYKQQYRAAFQQGYEEGYRGYRP
jgi:hypothetical protein